MEIQRHEESMHTHQRLLRVRDELLKTIQAKDHTKLCRLSEIYPELNDKNSLINEVVDLYCAKQRIPFKINT